MGHKVPQKAEKYIQVLFGLSYYVFYLNLTQIAESKVPMREKHPLSGTFASI